jgi:hypothetical protein
LDKKLLVGVAVGVLVAIIVVVALLPSSGFLKNYVQENPQSPGALKAASIEIKPVVVSINRTSVLSSSDKEAVIVTKFDVLNPNDVTVILEAITYDLYENGVLVGHGQIGERLEGALESSNYYTLVEHYTNQLDGKVTIQNTGNNPQLWSALQKSDTKWNIVGQAYYNTNTVLSGQPGSVGFNSTQ